MHEVSTNAHTVVHVDHNAEMTLPPKVDRYAAAVDLLARRHINNAIRDRHGLNLDRTLNGAAMRDVQARVAEIADEIGNPGRGEFEAAWDVLQHGVGVTS